MSRPIITVENLSKSYLVGHQSAGRGERYTALRDVLTRNAKNVVRKTRDMIRGRQIIQGDEVEEFWALKDVSFDVNEGEVVGIIGRNGAGKSTLLKILSRITEPTEGRVTLRGRVASLLEVGTGFHAELTGRENIFLNGAILGMTRSEIKKKFDEIAAFAEVERFLDTPVKRYSSGMYVRLAFAVAAHLEPEILVIDEVLAVGDAEFQKKCIGKMQDVASRGRTVLFVSHHMATINRLCSNSILLERGQIKMRGNTHSVTAKYMATETGSTALRSWLGAAKQPGDEVAKLVEIRIVQEGETRDTIDIRRPVDIEMTYEVQLEGRNLLSGFSFLNDQGTILFVSADTHDPTTDGPRAPGIYRSVCRVPGNLFAEDMIRVICEVSTRRPVYQIHFIEFDAAVFQVIDKGEPDSVRGDWGRPIPGVMRPMCQWKTTRIVPRTVTAL